MVVCLVGCLGNRARHTTLSPALLQSIEQIEARGIDTADLRKGLEENDAVLALAAWGAVKVAAEADIQSRLDAGEIGPGVANSLRERLKNIEEGLDALGRLPP